MTDQVALRNFCFEGVDRAIGLSDIELTEADAQDFGHSFINGLEPRLTTPRMARRYENSLSFALPILKGEVHVVDHMLVEGMRIFYPSLYKVVKDNSDTFLGRKLKMLINNKDKEEEKVRISKVMEEGFDDLTIQERKGAESLLKRLFPRIRNSLGGIGGHGSEWGLKWAKDQRVASEYHFNRYFSYAIPAEDVPDQNIHTLVEKLSTSSLDEIEEYIRDRLNNRNAKRYIFKLRQYEEELSPADSEKLAHALSHLGDLCTRYDSLGFFDTPWSQAAILVSQLIRNITDEDEGVEIAKTIVQGGKPLSFASCCFQWIHAGKDEEQDRIFDIEKEDQIGKVLACRISSTAIDSNTPIYIEYDQDAGLMFWIWNCWGDEKQLNDYLSTTISQENGNAVKLIRCYTPTSFGGDSTLPKKSKFGRDNYDSLSQYVDPDNICKALCNIYDGIMENPRYESDLKRPIDEQLAHQFVYVHKAVKNESETSSNNVSDNLQSD